MLVDSPVASGQHGEGRGARTIAIAGLLLGDLKELERKVGRNELRTLPLLGGVHWEEPARNHLALGCQEDVVHVRHVGGVQLLEATETVQQRPAGEALPDKAPVPRAVVLDLAEERAVLLLRPREERPSLAPARVVAPEAFQALKLHLPEAVCAVRGQPPGHVPRDLDPGARAVDLGGQTQPHALLVGPAALLLQSQPEHPLPQLHGEPALAHLRGEAAPPFRGAGLPHEALRPGVHLLRPLPARQAGVQ
mmetsp:Transcript_99692/g.297814  ORF Transcript_99692/g.297814 Transcript_99692/m.297814 type:complete len:250 (-) Transcript_99692:237-986(-)